MKIITSSDDDFLYNRILKLLSEIKLAHGGNFLASSLRKHPVIRTYLRDKQSKILINIESTYFTADDLDRTAIEQYHYNLRPGNIIVHK